MTHSEINLLIEEYIDDALDVDTALEVESHLSSCSQCSEYLFSLRILKEKMMYIPEKISPEKDLWPEIFAQINTAKKLNVETKPLMIRDVGTSKISPADRNWRNMLKKQRKSRPKSSRRFEKKYLYFITAALLIAASAVFYFIYTGSSPEWEVNAVSGIPTVNNERVLTSAELEAGAVVNTAASQHTDIIIPGTAKITAAQNSVLKRGPAGRAKIEFITGKVSVSVSLNELNLQIILPGAEITQLEQGSMFRLSSVDGYILTEGVAAVVPVSGNGNTVYVPADYKCKVYEGSGPLIPYFSNTGGVFTDALERVAAGRETEGDWGVIQSGYTKYDLFSLWHLFPLVSEERRAELFTMIDKHVPPPTGTSQQGLLSLNRSMLMKWFTEIKNQY